MNSLSRLPGGKQRRMSKPSRAIRFFSQPPTRREADCTLQPLSNLATESLSRLPGGKLPFGHNLRADAACSLSRLPGGKHTESNIRAGLESLSRLPGGKLRRKPQPEILQSLSRLPGGKPWRGSGTTLSADGLSAAYPAGSSSAGEGGSSALDLSAAYPAGSRCRVQTVTASGDSFSQPPTRREAPWRRL